MISARENPVLLAILLILAQSSSTQDSLTAARDLYRAAAYDDALALLNRMTGSPQRVEENLAIEQYRALCLLALGRVDEAEHAIEAVVITAPSYHPSAEDASP